jgi:RHS repeat-associated protein
MEEVMNKNGCQLEGRRMSRIRNWLSSVVSWASWAAKPNHAGWKKDAGLQRLSPAYALCHQHISTSTKTAHCAVVKWPYVLFFLTLLSPVQYAQAEWFYYRTDAVETNAPPVGISVDTDCAAKYVTWQSAYGTSYQSNYLPPDAITRPNRDGAYNGEYLKTGGNCRLEYLNPYVSPPQWVVGMSFNAFYVSWAWCDGSTEWIPERMACGHVAKNQGPQNCQGNPINAGTGNKFQSESDYATTGSTTLAITRSYNSITSLNPTTEALGQPFGRHWRGTYSRAVVENNQSRVVYRPDGRAFNYAFDSSAQRWQSDADITSALVQLSNNSGWSYTNADSDEIEIYDANGRLQSITARNGMVKTLTYSDGTSGTNGGYLLDAAGNPTAAILPAGLLIRVTDTFGHTLNFGYDAASYIVKMVDSVGGDYHYAYDGTGNLSSVTYPDAKTRTYVYNEQSNTTNTNQPSALTGIVDEQGNRFATYQYNAQGGAISTEHAGGAEKVTLAYNADGTTTATDALGTARTMTFQTIMGVVKTTGQSQPCTSGCNANAATNYDASGNINSKTDFNGNVTAYTYDLARNLEASRTEASGTAQARTITTTWHAQYRLPMLISVYAGNSATGTPIRTTSFTYDSSGNQLTKTLADPATSTSRTWTYTYNNFGQVLTADGPRTDVSDITTYTYYTCTTGAQCGQLNTVTNTLGQTTTYNTYNVSGQPLTITDANGVITTLAYDARQRLTSRTVGTEATSYAYYPTSLLQKVTLPNGSYLQYSYDAAHRLTQIQDTDGNKVVYTLDAAGNHTAENLYDPIGTLKRTYTKVFNSLSQLYQDINAANTAAVTTTLGYDNNGNQTTINAPLTRNTSNQYDALNRLTQVTDPAGGIAKYQYDANDNLVSVIDPRNLQTTYVFNGLGDLTSQMSPDTGTTLNTYDSAGNLKTRTDARGQVTTFQYDALNRITQQSTSDQTLNYQYDQGANGIGHLTTVSDANHTTTFTFDAQGRVIQKSQTQGSITHTTQYAYTNGDLTQVTTPSGQVIAYSYTNGKVTGIAMNGATILNQIQYDPFGPIKQWTWGNGTTTSRTYDQDGYLTANASAGNTSYTFNPDGSIASQTNDSSVNLNLPTGLTTLTVAANSNRLTGTTGTLTRANVFDATGNLTSDGTRSFTFNGAGRMTSATNAGITTSYVYNTLGQRIKKTNANGTTYFVTDEAGHLLGEYNSTGTLIEEIVWLNDIPVATIRTDQSGGSVGVFYIHTDHLDAPSKITRPSDNAVIWRWDHDPYGNGTPNQDPDGNGLLLTMNLRFPGQYFDQETGLYYNMERYFDSQAGRYITSDPIGLYGGINTYAYVRGNPISRTDRFGLADDEPNPVPRIPVPDVPSDTTGAGDRAQEACDAEDYRKDAEARAAKARFEGDWKTFYEAMDSAYDWLKKYHDLIGQPIPGDRPPHGPGAEPPIPVPSMPIPIPGISMPMPRL